ncbi:MAG TPA: hypothetical protein VIJ40_08755 [Acidimicrobiales bacterium]
MDTTDRPSTGITHPPLIPVDGEYTSEGNDTSGYLAPRDDDSSVAPDQHRASLSSSRRYDMVEGEYMHSAAEGHQKPVAPDVNWLVVLGEG